MPVFAIPAFQLARFVGIVRSDQFRLIRLNGCSDSNETRVASTRIRRGHSELSELTFFSFMLSTKHLEKSEYAGRTGAYIILIPCSSTSRKQPKPPIKYSVSRKDVSEVITTACRCGFDMQVAQKTGVGTRMVGKVEGGGRALRKGLRTHSCLTREEGIYPIPLGWSKALE